MYEKVLGIVMNTSFYLYTWGLKPKEKYHKCKTFFTKKKKVYFYINHQISYTAYNIF